MIEPSGTRAILHDQISDSTAIRSFCSPRRLAMMGNACSSTAIEAECTTSAAWLRT